MNTALDRFSESFSKIGAIKKEIGKVIVGLDEAIDSVLIGLFAGGHLLLESAPGLAKTLMVEALGKIFDVKFRRIQLTPDILPQEITGAEMPIWGTTDFTVRKGPIFAGLVLADEFNRAPEKTQSAFVEAMQERQVTIGDTTHKLDDIFTLIATKNPIETGGTFPVAEAILDRFMFNPILRYPSLKDEQRIAVRSGNLSKYDLKKVCTPEEVFPVRDFLQTPGFVGWEHSITNYVSRIVQSSRPEQCRSYLGENDSREYVEQVMISLCSPRAAGALIRAAYVFGMGICGEKTVLPEHVKVLVPRFLRHRLLLAHGAKHSGTTEDQVIEWLLDRVPVYA